LEGHAKHTSAVLAATCELNSSAGHTYAAHAESPDAGLEVPGRQAEQESTSAPVYPGLQVQVVLRMLPAAESELPGHAEQAAEPTSDLYLPELHAEHAVSATGAGHEG